jgi:hypothetical protein
VIFTGGSKLSEHGGFNEDDVHRTPLVTGGLGAGHDQDADFPKSVSLKKHQT